MGKYSHEPKLLLGTMPMVFRYNQARTAGISRRALTYLIDSGDLELIERGLYRKTNAPLADLGLLALAIRAPSATLCLGTALSRHGLSDEIPVSLDIALPRGIREPKVEAPITWHHFHTATFYIGRNEIDLDGELKLGLYSPERSIVDAFRTRAIEGNELAITALKRWLRQKGSQPSQLLSLAANWPRTVPVIRRTLEVLL